MIEAGKIYLCETIEDAKGFLKQCDKQGIKWCDGTKASDEINYSYDEGTCYHVNSSFNREPIRDHENTTSFKCISNAFLLKHNL